MFNNKLLHSMHEVNWFENPLVVSSGMSYIASLPVRRSSEPHNLFYRYPSHSFENMYSITFERRERKKCAAEKRRRHDRVLGMHARSIE